MSLVFESKVRGDVRLVVKSADGKVRKSPWSKNMLLNTGLNAGLFDLANAAVGTGTNPPQPTDTSLQARLGTAVSAAGTGADTNAGSSFNGSVYSPWRITSYTFSPGAVVGNVSEVALYASSTISSSFIRMRALVLDVNGDPTTITVGATDQLTIEHKVTISCDLRPPEQDIVIDGVTYKAKITVCGFGFFNGSATMYGNTQLYPHSISAVATSSAGRIGQAAVNLPPLGTPSYAQTLVSNYNVYSLTKTNTADTANRAFSATFSMTINTSASLPTPADIGAVSFGYSNTTPNSVVVEFTPPLPKNSSVGYTFSLTHRMVVS